MTKLDILLLAGAVMLPMPAFAADPATAAKPMPSEVRLTPEQIDKVLAEAAKKREGGNSIAATDDPDRPKYPVHGEVGVAVGSGGYRSVFGGASVGLSNDGFASIYFEDQMGRERFRTWDDHRK